MNVRHWIAIPEGTVCLSAGGYLTAPAVFEQQSFDLTRYPITNEQFATFLEAGGYHKRVYWTAVGWRLKQKEGWTEPRHWHSDWNRPYCPVVGVSLHEALAFCAWLSETSGRTVTLPTEQQWQRAAQGDDRRLYPWGEAQPTEALCNWSRIVDETTPVDRYPAGASPFGVMDMSGNVWEWCLTGWLSGTVAADSHEPRLLRGGSWSSDSPLSLRASHRASSDPNTRLEPGYRHHVTVGFRCAALQPNPR